MVTSLSTGAIVPFIYNSAIKWSGPKLDLSKSRCGFRRARRKGTTFSQVVSTDHSRVGGSHQQVNVNAGITIIDTGIVLTRPDLNFQTSYLRSRHINSQ